MDKLQQQLSAFSKQINFALDQYRPHTLAKSSIPTILIGGLGGSGIAGRMIKNYYANKLEIPVEVLSDYTLPRYVKAETLVILSSYSGNSEETIALYTQAKEKNCRLLIITSGGELERLAVRDDYPVYLAEVGYEARMALGYSLTYLHLIFFEILGQYKQVDLKKIADSVSIPEDFRAQAADLAKLFEGRTDQKFIVVSDTAFEGIATRFAQQIQENAKLEAFVSVLPEASHNALETYYSPPNQAGRASNFVFLNSRATHQTSLRFAFLQELLSALGSPVLEYTTKDDTLATLYTTLYTLDWLALELAIMRGAEAETSKNVIALKQYLEKNTPKHLAV